MKRGNRANSCADIWAYEIVACDGYLNMCFMLAGMSLVVGNMNCPSDTPAKTGQKLALLSLKCSAALAVNTAFKNKGVAVNRFCCLIIANVVIYFKKLL